MINECLNTEVAGLDIAQIVQKIGFCEIILLEMSSHLEEIRLSTVLKKRFKPRKQY